MSQKQKLKTPVSQKRDDVLRQIGPDDTPDMSQTVDDDIVTSSATKKRQRKRISASQQESTPQDQNMEEDVDATPKRKSASSSQEEIKSKRKDTPIAKEPSKRGRPKKAEADKKGTKRNRETTEKTKRVIKKFKTAQGEFTKSEIESFQMMTKSDPIIPSAAFLRVVKEIIRDLQPEFRISREAFEMLRTVAEYQLTQVFYTANIITLAGKRQKVDVGHLKLASAASGTLGQGCNLGIHSTFNFKDAFKSIGYTEDAVAQMDIRPDAIAEEGAQKLALDLIVKNKAKGLPAPKKKLTSDDKDRSFHGNLTTEKEKREKKEKKEAKEKEKEAAKKSKSVKKKRESSEEPKPSSAKKSAKTPTKKREVDEDDDTQITEDEAQPKPSASKSSEKDETQKTPKSTRSTKTPSKSSTKKQTKTPSKSSEDKEY